MTAPSVARVPVGELPALLGRGLELDAAGTPMTPSVFVDLDGSAAEPAEIARMLIGTVAVVIGVVRGPLTASDRVVARELACTIGTPESAEDRTCVPVDKPDDAIDVLVGEIAASPRAAIALVRLLRQTATCSVADGLSAESAVYSMLLAGREFGRWLTARPPAAPVVESTRAVLIARSADALHVTINRPARRNAFNVAVREGLIEAFELASADPRLERVELRGAGSAFCSGGDLTEFGETDDVPTAHLIRLDRSVAARIDRCRDRTVAYLHGACIGAGVELPSFAGRVLARRDTFCQLPELRMGLIPGAGGTVGITGRIGRWRTAYLALTGAPIDAATAVRWGLVDEVVDE